MIVIGYQGIGKSTLAGRGHKYIDLESGNFWVDGKRADDWYKIYCNIAEHLSQQGYIVFVSSHEVVRRRLELSNELVVLIYPQEGLRDAWIDKLNARYKETGLVKDYKALMNAAERYNDNICELAAEENFNAKLVIINMNYDLEAMLVHFINEYERGDANG